MHLKPIQTNTESELIEKLKNTKKFSSDKFQGVFDSFNFHYMDSWELTAVSNAAPEKLGILMYSLFSKVSNSHGRNSVFKP